MKGDKRKTFHNVDVSTKKNYSKFIFFIFTRLPSRCRPGAGPVSLYHLRLTAIFTALSGIILSTISSYIPYLIDKILKYYILYANKVKEIKKKTEKSSPKVKVFFVSFRSSCLQKFYKVAEKFTEK